eukprot:366788_1
MSLLWIFAMVSLVSTIEVGIKEIKMTEEIAEKKMEKTNEKIDIKILFLDVDGVLCDLALLCDLAFFIDDDDGLEREKETGLLITHLLRLKNIIDKTDCYIVLSSSWRLFEGSKLKLFNAMGMERIGIDVKKRYIGDTPLNLWNRVTEIKSWLSHHEQYNIIEWVAVDDLNLEEIKGGHFVHTNSAKGMCDDDMNKIISILNAK